MSTLDTPIFATCDWGHCDEPTVSLRYAGAMNWLCVCAKHANEPGAMILAIRQGFRPQAQAEESA
jgi:hypothetical protein